MTLQRAALWAIVVAATMYLLVAGRGLLLPFVLGLVLWYMIDALADAFEQPRIRRLRLPRPVALLAAVCVMGGLLWVVGRTIGRNISAVAAAAPTYERRLQILINEAASRVIPDICTLPSASCNWVKYVSSGSACDRESSTMTLAAVARFLCASAVAASSATLPFPLRRATLRSAICLET